MTIPALASHSACVVNSPRVPGPAPCTKISAGWRPGVIGARIVAPRAVPSPAWTVTSWVVIFPFAATGPTSDGGWAGRVWKIGSAVIGVGSNGGGSV